ncbi:MAG: twin-arginine translocation signal domain-containing protein [Planctomycetes bacterium]|nr:twin-arginine translocation signal domain-containing protein [Planctomycetota bacterium]
MKMLQTRRDFMKMAGLTTMGIALEGCQSAPADKRITLLCGRL